MATLLRKSRSIISARADHNGHVNNEVQPPLPQRDSGAGLFQQFSSIRNRRRSRIDLTTAVESEQSAAARQQREEQLQKQHSLIQLRRRLVRKASTFNLHTRHRSSPQKDLEKYRRSEHLFLDADDETFRPQTQQTELDRPCTASSPTLTQLRLSSNASNPPLATQKPRRSLLSLSEDTRFRQSTTRSRFLSQNQSPSTS